MLMNLQNSYPEKPSKKEKEKEKKKKKKQVTDHNEAWTQV